MTEFKTIEKEYLNIDPFDKDKICPFYERHKRYFDNNPPIDNSELIVYLRMLTEIGQTFSFSGNHKSALSILEKAISHYETNEEKLAIDLKKDESYNNAIWNKVYSHFELRQYVKARLAFTKMNGNDVLQLDDKNEALIQICNWKIKNRIAVGLGITGLFLLFTNYSIKWFSPENYSIFLANLGNLGALLLIVFGLIYKTKIKAHTINNG